MGAKIVAGIVILLGCGLVSLIGFSTLGDVSMYAIDSAYAYQTDPQTRIEKGFEFQQATSPSGPQSQVGLLITFSLGAVAMLGVFYFVRRPEHLKAGADYLKQQRLLMKAKKGSGYSAAAPIRAMRPHTLPRLPHTFPDEPAALGSGDGTLLEGGDLW